jgi:hypothetical protein
LLEFRLTTNLCTSSISFPLHADQATNVQKAVSLLQQAAGQPVEDVGATLIEVDQMLSALLENHAFSAGKQYPVWEALWEVIERTDSPFLRARVMHTATIFLRLDLVPAAGVSSAQHVGALADVCCGFVELSYSKVEQAANNPSQEEEDAAEWLNATTVCLQYMLEAGTRLHEREFALDALFFGELHVGVSTMSSIHRRAKAKKAASLEILSRPVLWAFILTESEQPNRLV